MPGEDQEYKYQLFISYTEADRKWAEQLYRRLEDKAVRVFFAHESIAPGEKITLQVSDALNTSYKVAMVMSKDYFDRPWPRAEWSSVLMKDPENRDRRLIPLLRRECDLPDLLADLKAIDFTNDDDFELSFLKLLEVVEDKPKPRRDDDAERHFLDREFDKAERGRLNYKRGKSFEEEIATLYRLFGFDVKQDVQLNGVQIDLLIEKREGGLLTQAVVECKDKKITSAERDQILAQQGVALRSNPRLRWIAVSSQGFAADTRAALESAGVDCVIAADMKRELLPLEDYVGWLIADYERDSIQEKWQGNDWFVRPDFQKDRTGDTIPALEYMANWLGDDRKRQLVILGDVGTGKSTLVQFLAYQMARNYVQDPVRHPAPVLVPLGKVRKESSLQGVIHEHFSGRSDDGRGVNFQRFLHLVHEGKIVLFFDAFDEMADRLNYDDTFNTFRELSRAAQLQGKVVITGRVNYFKDVEEQREIIEEAYRAKGKDIYREATRETGHEVTYLKYFDEPKIRTYLGYARAATAENDWQKIVQIYDLRGLAQLPLLLTMISDSLDKFAEGEKVDAAKLYEKYTDDWLTRDLDKGRVILRRHQKLNLMYELAWRLWNDPDRPMRYRELAAFVEEMGKAGVVEMSGKEIEQMAGAIHLRSFLKREGENAFSFIHRSFMEYFLARRLYAGLTASPAEIGLLDTRQRFNHRVVHFLASIDTENRITPVLQPILTENYRPRISENALTILYWSARVCCGMDTEIATDDESLDRLKSELAKRLPSGIRMAGAQLSGIELVHAPLIEADFTGADLSKAKFDHTDLTHAKLTDAVLVEASFTNITAAWADFTQAKLDQTLFVFAKLDSAIFTKAFGYSPDSFADAELGGVRGLTGVSGKINLKKLLPVAQNLAIDSGYNALPVCFSPNGELLVIGTTNGTILIIRASDGALLWTLSGHTSGVLSVAFSPDGKTLASGSSDNLVRLWSAEDGRSLRTLSGHTESVWSVAFSPDGKTLASGSDDKSVRLWSAEDGRSLRTLSDHTDSVWSVAFSPDGTTLASGSSDKSVRLWSAEDGRFLHTLSGHTDAVLSVAFSPNGKTLASGSDDKSLRLWSVEDGRSLRTLSGYTESVWSVAFSPDGKTLASGSSYYSVRLWAPDDGRSLRTLSGHTKSVWSVSFSLDGKAMAIGGGDGSVGLWFARSGRPWRILTGHNNRALSVAFSPDGKTLVSAGDDKTIRLWSCNDGRSLRTLTGHSDRVLSVVFSPDGKTLASGSDDRSVRLWSATSGNTLQTLSGHTGYVMSVAFSPDGNRLASSSSDYSIRLWSAEEGRSLQTFSGHKSSVLSVAFSPEGKTLASGSDDRSVRLWSAEDRRSLRTLSGHKSGVLSVAFSPDGKTLASASDDKSVRLWSAEGDECLAVLGSTEGAIQSVAFAPSGVFVCGGGRAGRLQFWDLQTGKTALLMYNFGEEWLMLLPDGRFDFSSPDALRYLRYTEIGTFNSYRAEDLVKEFHSPEAVKAILTKMQK